MTAVALNLAAIGDLHITKKSAGVFQPIFAQANERADVLLLAGDLTDYGLPEEAHVLVTELSRTVKIPIIAVLGNHDFESGKQAEVTAILSDAGVIVLDGDTTEVHDVGFVGVKGFCGGFGRRTLEPWGEPMVKAFVNEALNESMKLESGLARLRNPHRVALLHYSPVEGTVAGEPLEIFPFLGSSRLEDPLNRYGVSAVFHGHAHRGAVEATTREGVPVYNVAAPLLRRVYPDAPPFRVVTVGADRERKA